eukprot:SAG22_NODE_733_length_7580_cov_2.329501_3_plen_433_part_00
MATAFVGAGMSGLATAAGLGIDAAALEKQTEIFKMQLKQTKRLWAADWAETSWRHGEDLLQAARQHQEDQALAAASYYQNQKNFQLGRYLDYQVAQREFALTLRNEIRESLRDELGNQNNRFNNVMLCDTVCLGCAFALVVEGIPPQETSQLVLGLYLGTLGLSICLFTVSLWLAVIIIQRLNAHTASGLERKLYLRGQEENPRKAETETNPTKITKDYEAQYEKWIAEIGAAGGAGMYAVDLLSVGVVSMFASAGFLTHARYLIDYQSTSTVIVFWSGVAVTAVVITVLARRERTMLKGKQKPMYDNEYLHDESKYNASNFFHKNITHITQDLDKYANPGKDDIDFQVEKDVKHLRHAEHARKLEVEEVERAADSESLQVRAFVPGRAWPGSFRASLVLPAWVRVVTPFAHAPARRLAVLLLFSAAEGDGI